MDNSSYTHSKDSNNYIHNSKGITTITLIMDMAIIILLIAMIGKIIITITKTLMEILLVGTHLLMDVEEIIIVMTTITTIEVLPVLMTTLPDLIMRIITIPQEGITMATITIIVITIPMIILPALIMKAVAMEEEIVETAGIVEIVATKVQEEIINQL